MRVLVLGGLGMLGHRVWIRLSAAHETWATVRGSAGTIPDLPAIERSRIVPHVELTDAAARVRALEVARPDVVINCAGLIKQRPESSLAPLAIRVNALLPHELADDCRRIGARLIHVSTDCVFSGRLGGYDEDSPCDPLDLYGRTKLLGEVSYPHTLTLRTSLIGREIASRFGLVEWFLASRGAISGYSGAIFSGVTTHVFADTLAQHVVHRADLHGILHISVEPITKLALLELLRDRLGHPVDITPSDAVGYDRSLDSTRFRRATGFIPPSWEAMIDELARHATSYAPWRSSRTSD